VNISEPFIRRPIATSLLMAGVVILGVLGYRLLPISALPAVDFPTIQVTTRYPGASPDVMTSAVTTPLERQFGQISGLESMSSVSSFGISTITLQFSLDRNIDVAAQDVQAAINAAGGVLAKTPNPPTYNKVNPADTPIMTLAITSPSLPLDKVNDFADSLLGQKLSQITGVGLVSIQGNQKPAVRVQVNPAALSGLGLGLEDVRTILTQANVNAAKGSFDGDRQAYTIGSNDQILKAADYEPIIVAYKNGAPVRLKDIGDVIDSVENEQIAAWVGEEPAVLLDIQRQPGANIIETVERVKALLPKLTATLPPSVKVSVLSDRTETIRASVKDVQFTLLLTIVLVVMVMFVFLRKLWATVITSIALPISLIGTFGVMYLVGFSLDNLSLMALTISTGFVVDDAIVMIENIVRYLEQGESPLNAALKGAKQIGFTVVSLSVSLIAVFIPLLFMTGIVGRLFREFAITLSVAVIVSAIVSLTLTPMMCAKLLGRDSQHEEGKDVRHAGLMGWFEWAFDKSLEWYEHSLRWVMQRQKTTLYVAAATLVATILLYIVIPKGLLPQQDTGLIIGVTDAAQNISFKAMVARQRLVSDAVRKDPDVQSVGAFVGAGTVNPTVNNGRLYIVLKPREKRSAGVDEIMQRLRKATANIEGISLFMQPAQDLQIDTRISRTQYQYILEAIDPNDLATWAPQLLDKMKTIPALQDVASDQQSNGLQLTIDIDREKASRLNILTQAIDDTLYDAFGQRQVSVIYTQLNQFRVILEVPQSFRDSPDALDKLYVKAGITTTAATAGSGVSGSTNTATQPSATGALVPLSAFAKIHMTTAPLSIAHQNQLPAITLSFNLRPGYSLGDATDALQKAKQEIGMPDTITGQFSGSAAEFRSSLASVPYLILAAIIVIYIVLGVLYESYIHPITILSTLPSAGVGALLALILFRIEFSLIALIGVILLIGIVKKNAIMMIDFALEAEREQGLSPEESIFQACLLRFRPIMMTTAAALLGALPLALQHGTGSELRIPLGVSIVGGLLVSQVLTLYTTPVIYLYMDRFERLLANRLNTGNAPGEGTKSRPAAPKPELVGT
jgi:hydrophobe/amphiphile efflux-1 (HAE1) family protein